MTTVTGSAAPIAAYYTRSGPFRASGSRDPHSRPPAALDAHRARPYIKRLICCATGCATVTAHAPHRLPPRRSALVRAHVPEPTPAQRAAWPAIRAGRHTLVAAPTGLGKTLMGFLSALDALVRRGLDDGGLPDETVVVYVSSVKALSNDIRLNLDAPLAGVRAELAGLGLPDVEIRTAVRTGGTPAAERQKALRKPPHILVTTPESLYVLLGSASGRGLLSTVRTVIVDEIHAVAASKRGSHLALSLEDLQSLCAQPLVRIGLSATQKPIDEVARFLVGAGDGDTPPTCEIVDIGYGRRFGDIHNSARRLI